MYCLPLKVPIAAAELKEVERVGFSTGLRHSRRERWIMHGENATDKFPPQLTSL
jgi:hypothetical protein